MTTICHPCHKDDGFLTTSQKVIAYLPESQPLPPGFAISQEPQARGGDATGSRRISKPSADFHPCSSTRRPIALRYGDMNNESEEISRLKKEVAQLKQENSDLRAIVQNQQQQIEAHKQTSSGESPLPSGDAGW
ncbi:MAG TPA: hypothetical protein VIS99_17550 [Terrimicrobiaceae bacterium]